MCRRRGQTYTGAHMRTHLIDYAEKNEMEIREIVDPLLKKRGMNFQEYLQMMKRQTTCGFEITLLILARMFKISILVVRSDYLWLSEDIAPIHCDVVLVQASDGNFYGTKTNRKVDIGEVPKFDKPKREAKPTKKTDRKSVNTDTEPGLKTPARSSRSENSDQSITSPEYVQSTSTPKGSANQKSEFNSSLSPIEERKSVNTSDTQEPKEDVKQATQIKRLGVSGPKKKISIQMDDISVALSGRNSITVRKVGDKEILVRLACNKCRKDFYTMAGYESHLLMDHRIRNSRLHPPKLIEKEDITLSSPSFNNSKIEDEDEKVKQKPTDVSSGSTVEKDASLPDIILPWRTRNDERKFGCEYCSEAFFYVGGLNHHLNSAHSEEINEEEDADDEAEQIEKGEHSSRSKVKNTKPNTRKPREKSVGARKSKCKGVPMKVKESVVETIVKTVRYTRSQSKRAQQLAEQIQDESKEKIFMEKSSDLSKDDFAREYNLRKKPNVSSSATITGDEEQVDKSENTDPSKELITEESKSEPSKKPNGNIDKDNLNGDASVNTEQNTTKEEQENSGESASPIANTDKVNEEPSVNTDKNTTNEEDKKSENSPASPMDDTDADPNFEIHYQSNTEEDNPEEIISEEPEKLNNKRKSKEISKQPAKKAKTKTNKGKASKKSERPDDEEDMENDDFSYYCDKCNNKFYDWNELMKHKYDCVKIPRKHVCPKCNRGFQQKCLMQQHYDFFHTNKPKKFVCPEHKKVYVYKKSLAEHKLRDHSEGHFKYVCDYCGKGFFHKSEFTIHRDGVHLRKKDFACNRCQEKAFTTVGRLNAHLERCGKTNNIECNQCGKLFASKESLYIHISDTHRKDMQYECPLCKDKIYDTQGGFYSHLRVKHNISRKTVKLSDFIKANQNQDPEEDSKSENSDNTDELQQTLNSSENTDLKQEIESDGELSQRGSKETPPNKPKPRNKPKVDKKSQEKETPKPKPVPAGKPKGKQKNVNNEQPKKETQEIDDPEEFSQTARDSYELIQNEIRKAKEIIRENARKQKEMKKQKQKENRQRKEQELKDKLERNKLIKEEREKDKNKAKPKTKDREIPKTKPVAKPTKRKIAHKETPAEIPKKKTRSSGPVTWDCGICGQKFERNEQFYKHLFLKHQIKGPGFKFN